MSARVPAHALIPAIKEAVRLGNDRHATIRAALKLADVSIGASTLSSVLRLAVAQGAIERTGNKRYARYSLIVWHRRRKFKLDEQESATVPEPPTFEDL